MKPWLLALTLLAWNPAQAAVLTMDFANNARLGFGVGTNQTITQNGIRMQALEGLYEITENPYHELNLKDFSSTGSTRTVEFSLVSGLNFDFLDFSRQAATGNATITSSRGGSVTFSLRSAVDFSSPLWDDLQWIKVSSSQRFGEFKFNSFTFNDAPTVATVPVPPSLALLAAGCMLIGCFRRRDIAGDSI